MTGPAWRGARSQQLPPARTRIPDWAHRSGLEPASCERLFDGGAAAGAPERAGDASGWLPDADTTLARDVDAERGDIRRPRITRRDHLDPSCVACWDFERRPLRAHGEVARVALRHVPILEDECVAGHGFARLGVFGASEIRLGFVDAGEPGAVLTLGISLQKGQRNLLPHGGEARLDVLLDGRPIARDYPVLGPGTCHVALPLYLAGGKVGRTVTLRLGPESTTTLRVYTVHLRRP